jgi:hypothetical protein
MKKKNENIVKELEQTIETYNDVMSSINENCDYNYITVDLINFYNNLCVECEEQVKIIKKMIKLNDDKIYEQCEHNFITDIIEIGPEKEQTICYCTICELTKRK